MNPRNDGIRKPLGQGFGILVFKNATIYFLSQRSRKTVNEHADFVQFHTRSLEGAFQVNGLNGDGWSGPDARRIRQRNGLEVESEVKFCVFLRLLLGPENEFAESTQRVSRCRLCEHNSILVVFDLLLNLRLEQLETVGLYLG